MNCPKCHSENTQRLSVIYQSGTQLINTTSNTYGGGIGSGYGGGVATTNTSGTAQSYLAMKAAPPDKKKFKLASILIVAGILIGWASGSMILFLLPAAVGIFFGRKDYRYNKDVYPGLREEWRNSWHCNKCDAIYIQQ